MKSKTGKPEKYARVFNDANDHLVKKPKRKIVTLFLKKGEKRQRQVSNFKS